MEFITLIRNPVKRWLSHYYFDRHRDTNVNYNKTDLGIHDYLKSKEGLKNARLYLRHFSNYIYGDQITSEHVESAVHNILKFDVYGILERMDWFIEDYKSLTGIRLKQLVRNTNPKKITPINLLIR